MRRNMNNPPEHWLIDAGDAAQAVLTIPADAKRQRRFEISCAMTVALREDRSEAEGAAWHQMTVQAGGTQQWQRRVVTQNPGAWDGLDYRFTHSVPVGRALRLVVSVACQGSRRRSVKVEAEEI
jgi:hypothetical protein